MNQRIRENYLNPEHPTAFSSPGNLKRYYRDRYETRPILETLQGIGGYTAHREYHKPRVTNPFYVYKKRQQIQMDLIDVSRLKEHNNGVTFILCAIDSFTKYAWVIALKDKSAKTSLAAMKIIIEGPLSHHRQPDTIFFDRGTEFKNRLVKNYLDSRGILMVHPSSEKKAAIVERFNRTLQGLIYRYMTENHTKRYYDAMPDLVRAYNSRGHRTLKYMSPIDADEEKNQDKILDAHNERYSKVASQRKKPKYQVGERVLVKSLPTNRFHRGYERSFREEQFEIVEVKKRMPIPMYILKSLDKGDIIEGGFYAEELQPVKGDVFKMEVLRRRNYRGKQQLFVRWIGFDDTHNQWIDADSVTQTYN
jgi:transposase InsO family protein